MIKLLNLPEPQFFLVGKEDNHLYQPSRRSLQIEGAWEHSVNPKGLCDCDVLLFPLLCRVYNDDYNRKFAFEELSGQGGGDKEAINKASAGYTMIR